MNKITKHKLLKIIDYYNERLKYINFAFILNDYATASRILLVEHTEGGFQDTKLAYNIGQRGYNNNTPEQWLKYVFMEIRSNVFKMNIDKIIYRSNNIHVPIEYNKFLKKFSVSKACHAFIGKGIRNPELGITIRSQIKYVDNDLSKWMGGTHLLKVATNWARYKSKDWEQKIK